MRIGLDFDNTIVRYDALFHRVAREMADIPAELPPSKVLVRNHLRAIGREALWTEMQGIVYGPRMGEAEIFPGLVDFLQWAGERGHALCIVSHRTRHPFLGPPYDLHQAARDWIGDRLRLGDRPLIAEDQVFFETTKPDKLARIAACGCRLFIDDLPEILRDAAFPADTRPLLFDPDGLHATDGLTACASWPAIRHRLEDEWTTPV